MTNVDIFQDNGSPKLPPKNFLFEISFTFYYYSVSGTDKTYTKKDKDKIKSILNHLPEANSETLRTLLNHLIEVAKYKDQNKMDTYNLSVCWGPTVIFATEAIDMSNCKDIMTQSTEAARMFESLLLFFTNNPEELDIGTRKQVSDILEDFRWK